MEMEGISSLQWKMLFPLSILLVSLRMSVSSFAMRSINKILSFKTFVKCVD